MRIWKHLCNDERARIARCIHIFRRIEMILTFKTSDVTRHTPMLRVASVERKEKNNARPETSMKRTYRTRNNFIPEQTRDESGQPTPARSKEVPWILSARRVHRFPDRRGGMTRATPVEARRSVRYRPPLLPTLETRRR